MHRTSLCLMAFCLATGVAMADGATLTISGDAPMGSDGFVVREAHLHYQPADLSTAPGQDSLVKRIHKAATVVCTVNPGSTIYHNQKKIAACEADAEKEAIGKLDLPDATRTQMLASLKPAAANAE